MTTEQTTTPEEELLPPEEIHTLEATGLRKQYGSRQVVKSVDLSVKSGEVVGLLGPERRREDDELLHGGGVGRRRRRQDRPRRA